MSIRTRQHITVSPKPMMGIIVHPRKASSLNHKESRPLYHPSKHEFKQYILSKNDFKLEQYLDPDPDHFFRTAPRPLRLIESDPSVKTYVNAIYTPAICGKKQQYGCLYDDGLRRIETSCVLRGREDRCLSKEAPFFQQEMKTLATYEYPTVYLGYITDHYGHFLLESLAKWWFLNQLALEKSHYLIHVDDPRVLDSPIFQTCLLLAGIDREKVVYFDKPVKIKEVIVPEVSFQVRSHIHFAYRKMWANFLDTFDVGEANKTSQPLYISKSALTHGISKYLGEDKVENYLSSKGVFILHPQKHTVEEQIRLFNKHSRIFGIAGSGMHNIVFSRLPKTTVILSQPHVNPNYFLIDKCFDIDSTYLQACQMHRGFVRIFKRFATKFPKIYSESIARGFIKYHRLDHRRVIDWFKKSGHL